MNRSEELIHNFLVDSLTEQEAEALLRELRQAPEFHDQLLGQILLDGALRAHFASSTDSQALIRQLKNTQAERTAQAVVGKIKSNTAAARTARASRRTSPGQGRKTKRRPLPLLWGISGLAAATLLVCLYALQAGYFSNQPAGQNAALTLTLSEVRGGVRKLVAETAVPLAAGNRLLPGDTLGTDRTGSSVLTWPDGSTLSIYPETTLLVADTSRLRKNRELQLRGGQFSADIAPQPTGVPFVARAEHSQIEVAGTKLTYLSEPDMDRLLVTNGTVRLFNPLTGESAMVKAGHEGRVSGKLLQVVEALAEMRRVDTMRPEWRGSADGLLTNQPLQTVEAAFASYVLAATKGPTGTGRTLPTAQYLVDLAAPAKAFRMKKDGNPDWSQPDRPYFEELDRKIKLAGAYGLTLNIKLFNIDHLRKLNSSDDAVSAGDGFLEWMRPYVKSWVAAGHNVGFSSKSMLTVDTPRIIAFMSATFAIQMKEIRNNR